MIKSAEGQFVQTSYPDIRKYLYYLADHGTFFVDENTRNTFNAAAGEDTARRDSRLERREEDRSNFKFF